ncbi:hypothetical protein [Fischerella sp. PCC 9605]|uniref:hypothetical protein n=1 Tax=Fischerella sp. PCC 9605 TaxID=1173024 RepID=UPI0004BA4197|nr:hypothetical protein [Fischerella sp. PCC 9605]
MNLLRAHYFYYLNNTTCSTKSSTIRTRSRLHGKQKFAASPEHLERQTGNGNGRGEQ